MASFTAAVCAQISAEGLDHDCGPWRGRSVEVTETGKTVELKRACRCGMKEEGEVKIKLLELG